MKFIPLVISLFFGIQIAAQNEELQNKIEFVNSKIQQTEKGERLTWLDSLTKLTYRNPKLEYDAALRQTIDLAIALDSLNFAAKKVGDLIGFQNNFLGKPKEGLKLFNTYREKLSKGTDFGAIGRMYLNAADSYYYTGDIDTSFEYYAITKDYAEKAKDEYLYGYALMYTGYNESEIGKFAEASQSLKEASQIFTKLKDTTNMLGAKNALAVLYSRNAFYEEAEKERNESILLIGKTDRHTALTNLYFNAAEDHKKTGDFKQQLLNIKAAFLANSKTNNAFLAEPRILTQLVDAYCKNDSITQAEKYFEDLNSIYLKDKTEKLKEELVKAKHVLAFTTGDYKNAIKYSAEILSILKSKKTHLGDIVTAEQYLAEAYKASGDDINYKKHLLNHYTLKDSLLNIQNVKSLAYYQTLYETEKRDLKIENQNANISLLNLKNKSKTQLLIFGSLGLLFLFGGVIVYRSFVSAKKRGLVQKEKLELIVVERTAEITKQNDELLHAFTELKNTQSQLVQSEKMASLGELTAGIAHEIQNPLNFVNNFSEVNKELLAEMGEEIENGNLEEVKALAKDITGNEDKIMFHGKRADNIVKGMLQHSRSSKGEKEPTDINVLTNEYLRLAYHGLRAKDKSFNATMVSDFDESIGNVDIIPQDIGRVILNLITNAFYVVDEKKKSGIENYEPTVTVSSKKGSKNIEICVTDNGSGIPKKILNKIFDPFFTTKPAGDGTGLGLSLSYDIIKAHGGTLIVKSETGKGATFTINLPTNN